MRSVEIRLSDAPLPRPKRRGFPFDTTATPQWIPLDRRKTAANPWEDEDAAKIRKAFPFGLYPSPTPGWFPFDRRSTNSNPWADDHENVKRHVHGFLATIAPPTPVFDWYAFSTPHRDNNPLGNEDFNPVVRRGHNPAVYFVSAITHALPWIRRPQHDFPSPYEDIPPGRHTGSTARAGGGAVPIVPILIPEPPASPGGNVEVYSNLAETLVGPGGYSAGSGVLNVLSTGLPFPANGNFRVVISDPTSGNPRVILQVTGINSGTQFAVIAEGGDSTGFVNDKVTGVLTAGAMDAIRANISRAGTFASLPSPLLSKEGDRFDGTDGLGFRFDGSTWVPYSTSVIMRKPVLADYTAVNAASSSIADSGAGLYLRNAAAETGVNAYVVSAPGTPYALVARMAGYAEIQSSKAPGFGICFRNSSSGKIEMLQVGNASGAPELSVGFWTSATVFSSAIAAAKPFVLIGEPIWLAIADDGVNKEFAFSPDGVNWETIFSESRTANFTANQIGFCIHTDGAAQIVAGVLKSWKVS